jgi:hypothetical protein
VYAFCSVTRALSAYGGSAIEYERALLAPTIPVEHTTRWLAPFITAHSEALQQPSSSFAASLTLRDIHFEAIWALITQGDLDSKRQGTFVWPETLHLDKRTLIELTEGVDRVTLFAVAYRVVSVLGRSNPHITRWAFREHFGKQDVFCIQELDNWLKVQGVSGSKRAFLLPLVTLKQCKSHPLYIATQQRLLYFLMAEWDPSRQFSLLLSSLSGEYNVNDWEPSYNHSKDIKKRLLLLIRDNFSIYAERYAEITQGMVGSMPSLE